ncbi:MAG: hypothetical protein JSV36_05660 [Anaerolineae bacterium]|nr:MAG: hypothetical protein JSV36_05660 [Anaerolineae bacterium]
MSYITKKQNIALAIDDILPLSETGLAFSKADNRVRRPVVVGPFGA